MIPKKLVWQLFFPFFFIAFVSTSGVILYFSNTVCKSLYSGAESELYSSAKLVENQVKQMIEQNQYDKIDILCKQLGEQVNIRFTVILASGKVIGDSEKDIAEMDNHSDRPEIIKAKTGISLPHKRFSYTLKEAMLYLVIPINVNGSHRGFLRTSFSIQSIQQAIRKVYVRMIIAGTLILLICAILCWYASYRITVPITEIQKWSANISAGDFNLSIPLKFRYCEEMNSLAQSIYRMSVELNNRFSTMIRQRNEIQAVFSSMVEGVLAVDTDERIININQAASKLLDVNPQTVKGKLIQEVIRNSDLQKFVKKTIASRQPVEADIIFSNGSDRFLQANGTALLDSEKNNIGALVVLNDVTRIKKLENMRKEFVANVSHELKTPITSIKGFVETLLEGSVKDPDETTRFLKIIFKQTSRLMEIIEDLLALSKIEQDTEKKSINFEKTSIILPLKDAIDACAPKAEQKNIDLFLVCSEVICAYINPQLIQQAVANLIDNAIKYSNPDSRIQIEASETDNEIVVSVQDWGCGIEKKHLPRLFERFYRADKARNRKLGGTGLGLAIVKHIAHAHSGYAEVESFVGKGSVFSIHLPKK